MQVDLMMEGESSSSEEYLDLLVKKYTSASPGGTVTVPNFDRAGEESASELVITHASRLAAITHDHIFPPFSHVVGVGGGGDAVSLRESLFKVAP